MAETVRLGEAHIILRVFSADAVRGLKASGDALRRQQRALNRMTRQMRAFNRASRQMATGLLSVQGAVLGLTGGLGLIGLARAFVGASDQIKILSARLNVVTESTEEFNTVFKAVFAIAQETRQPFEALIDLYARVGRATKNLGYDYRELLPFVRTVAQTLIIAGPTQREANAALIQFAQGLSVQLRGDEFRSITEQVPKLALAIAEGLSLEVPGFTPELAVSIAKGIDPERITASVDAIAEAAKTGAGPVDQYILSLGQLRDLAHGGFLTPEVVVAALRVQGEEILQEFTRIPRTVSQAFTQLTNQFALTAAELSKTTGSSDVLIESLDRMRAIVEEGTFLRKLSAGFQGFVNILVAVTGNVGRIIHVLGVLVAFTLLQTPLGRSLVGIIGAFGRLVFSTTTVRVAVGRMAQDFGASLSRIQLGIGSLALGFSQISAATVATRASIAGVLRYYGLLSVATARHYGVQLLAYEASISFSAALVRSRTALAGAAAATARYTASLFTLRTAFVAGRVAVEGFAIASAAALSLVARSLTIVGRSMLVLFRIARGFATIVVIEGVFVAIKAILLLQEELKNTQVTNRDVVRVMAEDLAEVLGRQFDSLTSQLANWPAVALQPIEQGVRALGDVFEAFFDGVGAGFAALGNQQQAFFAALDASIAAALRLENPVEAFAESLQSVSFEGPAEAYLRAFRETSDRLTARRNLIENAFARQREEEQPGRQLDQLILGRDSFATRRDLNQALFGDVSQVGATIEKVTIEGAEVARNAYQRVLMRLGADYKEFLVGLSFTQLSSLEGLLPDLAASEEQIKRAREAAERFQKELTGRKRVDDLTRAFQDLGRGIGRVFSDAIVSLHSFEDAMNGLRNLLQQFLSELVRVVVFAPLIERIGKALGIQPARTINAKEINAGAINVGPTGKTATAGGTGGILGNIFSGIGKIFGKKQYGGLAGGLTLLGEGGPELADFNRPARIYSHTELSRALRGGGGGDAPTMQFTYAPIINTDDPATVRRIIREEFPTFEAAVRRALQQDLGRRSLTRRQLTRNLG